MTGVEWREALGIDNIAWDIYFLYDGDDEWVDLPKEPDFWMHQLGGSLIDRAPRLDGDLLTSKLYKALNTWSTRK